ncbi:hypothetical protein F4778DRAFT_787665 [Xylariomycetidae sp. FL2044]|nr:hypothetical protein F4778DRAFT_787665 [Xylariomycetidae sp. FL2044]
MTRPPSSPPPRCRVARLRHLNILISYILLTLLGLPGTASSTSEDGYMSMPLPGAAENAADASLETDVSIAIATTILHPDPIVFPAWLDYHLGWGRRQRQQQQQQGVQLVVVYMDDPSERALFERLCGNRPVALLEGSREAPAMSPESRLILRQVANMRHAIGFLRARGYTWLLHIDTDELLYGAPGPDNDPWAWARDPGVGLVNLVNHEALPVAFDTDNPFADCTYFWVNGVERNANFLAYGNGKSAVRLLPSGPGPGVEPQGPHNFSGHAGRTVSPPADRAMILHYPHPSFESWRRKFALYGDFPDHWFGDRGAPKIIDFMRQSRDVVARASRGTGGGGRTGSGDGDGDDWDAAREFFARRVLGDEAREEALAKGKIPIWPSSRSSADELETGFDIATRLESNVPGFVAHRLRVGEGGAAQWGVYGSVFGGGWEGAPAREYGELYADCARRRDGGLVMRVVVVVVMLARW